MTTDPGHIAADFVAALTDDELQAFIHDARSPADPPADDPADNPRRNPNPRRPAAGHHERTTP